MNVAEAPTVVLFSDEPGWHGRVLRRELENRGVASVVCSLRECALDLSGDDPKIVIPGIEDLPAAAFVRGVPGGSLEEIILRLNVLHALSDLGIPVMNSGRAIERTVDKSLTTFLLRRHGLPTPRTWVCESRQHAGEIAARVFADGDELVVKPMFGSQGTGVCKVANATEFANHEAHAGVYYLQEYLPESDGYHRDWRIFVIGGQAVAGMERRSSHWVTNRAQGADCVPFAPDRTLYRLAERAAAAVEVDYAGVDILRDRSGRWLVGEVNGIPAWQGLQRVSGSDITHAIVDNFYAKIARQSLSMAAP